MTTSKPRPARRPGALPPVGNSPSPGDLRIAKGARSVSPFTPIPEALDAIRAGRMVVVVDDEDRENEGDLTIAAEKVTPEIVNFMATHGRGLVCLAMTPERLDALEIPLEVPVNSSLRETAMCVSIDARGKTSTGISAADRAATILTAIDAEDTAAGPAAARPRVSRCAREPAACWCDPVTPRPRSTWRASPASRRPGSSARS